MQAARKWFLSFVIFLILLTVSGTPNIALAASKPVRITACQLSSANKVRITATASDTKEISGKNCYLFALTFSQSGIQENSRPLASAKKSEKMSFSVKLNNAKTSTLLYSRFVIASKTESGAYRAVSNTAYISNPQKVAKYKYKFPAATSKKGLQINANMPEDAIDLNIRHSALNIVFSDLLPTAAERNKTFSISYNYHGKTYWFRKALVNSYDAQLTALKENNVVVSAILLLGWRDDLKSLIYPSGRKAGHAFYAWNTSDAAAREQLQATLSFLGSRYGSSSAKHGRIVNWIVGNEVNNYNVYNYAGKKTLAQYAKIYANAFRMTYNTMTSIYANARVYISLDHLWNTRVSGSFTSREMLEKFASTLKGQGNISWNLAFHPYGSPLTEPRFWSNVNGQAIQSLTSPVISMNNISVLTSYIREKYGSKTRIILSEQGYTSVRHITIKNPAEEPADEQESESGSAGDSVQVQENSSAPGNAGDSAQTPESESNAGTVAGLAEIPGDGSGAGKITFEIDAQEEQAAAIAYSYYLAEEDDMIDSFIMNRQVDHQVEVDQGLDLGLWTTDPSSSLPEWADTKKASWKVFKYMDSNKAEKVTSDMLSVIGVQKWSDVISGYNKKLYCKNNYASSTLKEVKSYKKAAAIASDWKIYGAVSKGVKEKSTFTAYHDNSRNRNSLWGFTQAFSKKVNFSSVPYFYTTLNVQGASAAKARITIRFCSGKDILECSRTIPCGVPVKLGVSLKKWAGRKTVQKIQILVSPVKGKWSGNACITMEKPVRGR